MKKSKKYISIIISLLVVSFMVTGFILTAKITTAEVTVPPGPVYTCGKYYSGVTQGRFGSVMGAIPCIGGQVKSGSIVHYETSGYDQVEEEAEQANNGRFYNCYIDVSWQCAFNDGTEGSCRQCVPYDPYEPYTYNGECGNARYQCERGRVIENSKKENDTSYTWICAGSIDGEDSPICKEQKIDGKCSAVHYGCEEGEPVDKKDNTETNKYEWVCQSENGGKDDVCEELKSPENGVCGEERYECEVGTLDQTKSLLDKYTWVCKGLHGGETETCSIPKTINPDNECKGLCKLFENFGKTLKINYPFSDIKLKVDGGEVASSRAWAVCGNGLYWDSESGTCLKPETCPGEPDYPEPETPYWEYSSPSACIDNKITLAGVCINYDSSKDLYCQDEHGDVYKNKTKDITYNCFVNPPLDSTITVTLDAKIENDLDITEESQLTATHFFISWKAVTNPDSKFRNCDDIVVNSPSFPDIKTGGEPQGRKKYPHLGTPGSLDFSLTCHDKNGHSATAQKTVYFGKITGVVTER